MVKPETFRKMALAFPDASEQPHFEKISFRVGKKIFATYDESSGRACLKLPLSVQDLLSLYDKSVIYAVPNKWGKLGWTYIELFHVSNNVLTDALRTAYDEVRLRKRPRSTPGKFHLGRNK